MEPKPYAAAASRLRELIRQAEKGKIDPAKAAAAALSIARGALKQERSGVSKDGVPWSYADPKPDVALNGIVTALRISGQLGEKAAKDAPAQPRTPAEDWDALLADAKRELGARGYDVVPRVRQ